MPVAVPWYTPIDPPADLDGLLACSWTARPTGVHRLTPDGCTDLLCIDGGPFVLCGPERASWTFELPPVASAVGIRFRPGGAHATFGVDVSTIVDRRVPLAELIGEDDAAADATLAFLAEYFPTFPDMADPYKTASASWATMAS